MMKKVILGLFGLFLIMQLVQVDHENPEVDPSINMVDMVHPPKHIESTLKNACYSCHSFETVYPWYSYVAPFSWWINNHIEHGQEELNFSIWGTYSAQRKLHKIEEIGELVEAQEMPLNSYLWVHSEARLSDQEKKDLIDWSHTLK